MGAKITDKLKEINALPDQENWQHLEPEFREAYEAMLEYMQNPENNTLERTPELAKMDKDLLKLFDELHEIGEETEETDETEEIEEVHQPEVEYAENETEEQTTDNPGQETTEKTNDMKEKNKEPENQEQVIEQQQVTEETVINTEGDQEKHIENTNGSVDQPPVNNQNPAMPQNYIDFMNFAANQESISAKDFVKYKIPDAYWKENKVEFVFGSLKFKKTVACLIFNRWVVEKVQ
jgi:myosin heavy subunit